MKPLIDLSATVQGYGLEKSLVRLVKVRASQINGCAVCLDMHAREARKDGETEERLLMLDAWREAPLYTERERAALAWTEALTRLSEKGAPDDVYEVVQAHFSEEEQVTLDPAHRRHQRLQPLRRRLPRAADLAAAQGRLMAAGADAAAVFDPLRPHADAGRLPHARLGRRRRGCGAGRLPALAGDRPRGGAGARRRSCAASSRGFASTS